MALSSEWAGYDDMPKIDARMRKEDQVDPEKVLAWRDVYRVFCPDCGDPDQDEPLTRDDFDEGDLVVCDQCGKKYKIRYS